MSAITDTSTPDPVDEPVVTPEIPEPNTDPDIAYARGRALLIRAAVLADVRAELEAQDEKWGEQNHPDGTGPEVKNEDEASWTYTLLAEEQKRWNATLVQGGDLDWLNILLEEVYEAFAEDDPVRLREELVQVAAVALQWVSAIDRRRA